MKMFTAKGVKVFCGKFPKPKMSNVGGRNWVAVKKKVDGEDVDFWWDDKRKSTQMYFEMDGFWFKTDTGETLKPRVFKTDRTVAVATIGKMEEQMQPVEDSDGSENDIEDGSYQAEEGQDMQHSAQEEGHSEGEFQQEAQTG
jgi:hypothetical protein